MRKYNLFVINDDVYKKYFHNSKKIFLILNSLYHYKGNDYLDGFNIYRKMCIFIDIDRINNYFNKYAYINGKYNIIDNSETTYVKITKTRIIVTTNKNIPSILKIFNYYNKKIFVCDFENNDYFWLEILNNNIKIS